RIDCGGIERFGKCGTSRRWCRRGGASGEKQEGQGTHGAKRTRLLALRLSLQAVIERGPKSRAWLASGAAAPTLAQEPRARREGRPFTPARIEGEGAVGILERLRLEVVLVRIRCEVTPRAADLGRSFQDMRVVPVCEHGALTLHHRVEFLCDANAEALHSLGERAFVLRLDEQMNVIAEHAELAQAEA